MTRSRRGVYLRFLAVLAVLGLTGIGATIYVLVHERFVLPFQSVYPIKAQFSAADGVLPGTGQPVRVAGVNVGQITSLALSGGVAKATLQLNRSQIPRLYQNATATLTPITPLGDMAIDLVPGAPPARTLPAGGTISVAATSAPVPASEFLSRLDTDTRDYLTTLLSALQQGIGDRGAQMRRMFLAMGPTFRQVGELSHALATRRTQMARFVHNLALITHAASQDGQLSRFVVAGNATLQAMTTQDAAIRQTIAQLPETLTLAQRTLHHVRPFATQLGPALTSLLPALHRLPSVLKRAQAFSQRAIPIVRGDLRPLVRRSIPYFRALKPAVADLKRATPGLTGVMQTFNYLLNELAYVPGGGDQGFQFWIAWAWHNFNSEFSTGDANGAILRAMYLFNCNGIQEDKRLAAAFRLGALCPK